MCSVAYVSFQASYGSAGHRPLLVAVMIVAVLAVRAWRKTNFKPVRLYRSLDLLQRHFLQHDVLARTVIPSTRDGRDLVDHVLSFYDFAEDRVLAREPRRCRHRDEELRTIRVRAGIGHGQLARLVELVRRALGFVLELVAWAAHARALRVSALDHE